MVDVLLSHSNHVFHDAKQVEKMQPYPPLQTILAASVLRAKGITVALFDPTLRDPELFRSALDKHTPRMAVVCEDDFNFLSKMCLGRNRELSFRMAREVKDRGLIAAVHGSDSSDHPAKYLAAGFDYVLIGEVEQTLLELAQGLAKETIAGLAYLDEEGRVHFNAPRELATDLDALPAPAWDLVDVEEYREAWMGAHGFFSLNMASSRGCPYRCNWCAKPIYGNKYHARSPDSVASEMRHLKAVLKPDHLWFADDIFALSPKWTFAFADAVARQDAALPFKMQSRCDLMTRDTVAALQRAGCAEVWMGAESGSQKILDAMDKDIRLEHVHEARRNLRRHGIRAGFFLQFGYPGETWDDIALTIQMVRDAKPDDIGVSVSYPLPGTQFYAAVASQLGERMNWSESGDLAMIFRGAYSTEFYRKLADALHLEVRGAAADAIDAAWERVHQVEDGVAQMSEAMR